MTKQKKNTHFSRHNCPLLLLPVVLPLEEGDWSAQQYSWLRLKQPELLQALLPQSLCDLLALLVLQTAMVVVVPEEVHVQSQSQVQAPVLVLDMQGILVAPDVFAELGFQPVSLGRLVGEGGQGRHFVVEGTPEDKHLVEEYIQDKHLVEAGTQDRAVEEDIRDVAAEAGTRGRSAEVYIPGMDSAEVGNQDRLAAVERK
jgi:hypothetical protein